MTVDSCDYELEEEEILVWLRLYGEVFGKLREDIHQNNNQEMGPVGMGTYSVKMQLDSEIPQMLPMFVLGLSVM